MNIKEIKEMLNLMNENSLVELEIEKDGTRIRLKKADDAHLLIGQLQKWVQDAAPAASV